MLSPNVIPVSEASAHPDVRYGGREKFAFTEGTTSLPETRPQEVENLGIATVAAAQKAEQQAAQQ